MMTNAVALPITYRGRKVQIMEINGQVSEFTKPGSGIVPFAGAPAEYTLPQQAEITAPGGGPLELSPSGAEGIAAANNGRTIDGEWTETNQSSTKHSDQESAKDQQIAQAAADTPDIRNQTAQTDALTGTNLATALAATERGGKRDKKDISLAARLLVAALTAGEIPAERTPAVTEANPVSLNTNGIITDAATRSGKHNGKAEAHGTTEPAVDHENNPALKTIKPSVPAIELPGDTNRTDILEGRLSPMAALPATAESETTIGDLLGGVLPDREKA
jgi:hypothetical protein